MPTTKHNPKELFPQYRCYSHATEVHGDSRLLFISGLNGYLPDGRTMPDSFEEQAEMIWMHIRTSFAQPGWICITWFLSVRTWLIRSSTKPTCECASSFWALTSLR
jgi:2-iminobutanoate/2-iminopropanoate deaminase